MRVFEDYANLGRDQRADFIVSYTCDRRCRHSRHGRRCERAVPATRRRALVCTLHGYELDPHTRLLKAMAPNVDSSRLAPHFMQTL